jgi:hypothetical protein
MLLYDMDIGSLRCLLLLMYWQVDEIINIRCPPKHRYQQAPPGPGIESRCLQLTLTDGVREVFGMEMEPIEALQPCANPRGLKVATRHPFHLNTYIYTAFICYSPLRVRVNLTDLLLLVGRNLLYNYERWKIDAGSSKY